MNELIIGLIDAQRFGDFAAEAVILPKLSRALGHRYTTNQNDDQGAVVRFYRKIAFGSGECWHWVGHNDALGYGRVAHPVENKAHRVSWVLHNGPIPAGTMVLHKCDIRNCVNPAHLYLGTQTDNMRDMAARGRGRPSPQYGESNPRSKLDWPTVLAIRADHAAGGTTMKSLAAKYGVAPMTINRITRGETWTRKQ